MEGRASSSAHSWFTTLGETFLVINENMKSGEHASGDLSFKKFAFNSKRSNSYGSNILAYLRNCSSICFDKLF